MRGNRINNEYQKLLVENKYKEKKEVTVMQLLFPIRGLVWSPP